MTSLDAYRRAQDRFDAVLSSVPAERWDAPSMCAGWTLRDVAGHIIWGLSSCDTGQPVSTTPVLTVRPAQSTLV